MTSGKKMLSPEKLLKAVVQIGELARNEHIRIALVGGFALQFYGSDRLTGDVDVVSEERIVALPPGQALTFGGEATTAPNGVPVDVIIRRDAYAKLYAASLEKALPQKGQPIPLVLPEYLAAMKMVARRPKDMVDLHFLILSPGLLDRKKTQTLVRRFLGPYAADEFKLLVAEVEWKASQGRV